jgi:hypothetical protein
VFHILPKASDVKDFPAEFVVYRAPVEVEQDEF